MKYFCEFLAMFHVFCSRSRSRSPSSHKHKKSKRDKRDRSEREVEIKREIKEEPEERMEWLEDRSPCQYDHPQPDNSISVWKTVLLQVQAQTTKAYNRLAGIGKFSQMKCWKKPKPKQTAPSVLNQIKTHQYTSLHYFSCFTQAKQMNPTYEYGETD